MPIDFNSFVPRTYDAVVDAAGNGDYTTLQAADDALVDGYTLFVKQGTYTSLAVTTHNAKIFCEAGTILQNTIVLSGDNVVLELGSGSDAQDIITLSGDGCQLLCRNGVDLDGIVISGAKCLVDGGGWDTISDGTTENHGISMSGADGIVRNISVDVTIGNAYDGINLSGARGTIDTIRVVDTGQNGIATTVDAVDATIKNCTILGADADGIDVLGPRMQIFGNYIVDVGGDGVDIGATGDNSVIDGNIIDNATGNVCDIHVDAENCVYVGNRTDGAVADNSGTSTVADNDETAF